MHAARKRGGMPRVQRKRGHHSRGFPPRTLGKALQRRRGEPFGIFTSLNESERSSRLRRLPQTLQQGLELPMDSSFAKLPLRCWRRSASCEVVLRSRSRGPYKHGPGAGRALDQCHSCPFILFHRLLSFPTCKLPASKKSNMATS